MNKITINVESAEYFELAKSDDFIATENENIIRRGSALFFVIAGRVDIYTSEAEAKHVFNALWVALPFASDNDMERAEENFDYAIDEAMRGPSYFNE